jgi:hypothetical protein
MAIEFMETELKTNPSPSELKKSSNRRKLAIYGSHHSL